MNKKVIETGAVSYNKTIHFYKDKNNPRTGNLKVTLNKVGESNNFSLEFIRIHFAKENQYIGNLGVSDIWGLDFDKAALKEFSKFLSDVVEDLDTFKN